MNFKRKKIFNYSLAVLIVFLVITIIPCNTAYAVQGDNGYEGGISSGETPNIKSYDYEEAVFITGKPVKFSGKLVVSRPRNNESGKLTYRYTLYHGLDDKLMRTAEYDMTITDKGNGQVVKTAVFKKLSETVTIDGERYTLDKSTNPNFSMSTITDCRPAVDYFSGNWDSEKTYVGPNGESVIVNITGDTCGYEQHWGSTESQTYKMTIECITQDDEWGGIVEGKIASRITKELIYMKNRPNEISFEGGYLQKQKNEASLQYKAMLPVFDKKGIATDRMKTYTDELNMESFPQQQRLIVPDIQKIRGAWYEQDVQQLCALEVFDENDMKKFMPEQYITRGEFAKAIALAANIQGEEEQTKKSSYIRRRSRSKKEEEKSPFVDVPTDHPYYKYIKVLNEKGVMSGKQGKSFEPGGAITRAEALTIFIRALGFEDNASTPNPVTYFIDNDKIPDWARGSIEVAVDIGLVKGFDDGSIKSNQYLTKADAANLINNFIIYMRENIIEDYTSKYMMYGY